MQVVGTTEDRVQVAKITEDKVEVAKIIEDRVEVARTTEDRVQLARIEEERLRLGTAASSAFSSRGFACGGKCDSRKMLRGSLKLLPGHQNNISLSTDKDLREMGVWYCDKAYLQDIPINE